MGKLILILLVALVLEALGVVVLKAGLAELGELRGFTVREVARLVGRGVTHPKVLLGVAMEAAFFALLLVMLKNWDVSLIWPLTSLGFVLTTLAARYVGGEQVPLVRWAGVFLIMAGAALVAYSERLKTAPPAEKPAAAANGLNRE